MILVGCWVRDIVYTGKLKCVKFIPFSLPRAIYAVIRRSNKVKIYDN
jgi:hypothetical protein